MRHRGSSLALGGVREVLARLVALDAEGQGGLDGAHGGEVAEGKALLELWSGGGGRQHLKISKKNRTISKKKQKKI